jgi:EAL domain-containing protein (putative c-di-GMP-specific phosphodiesterase class I)
VQDLLRISDFPPEYLTLEITESAMMADTERASRILNRLDEMGVNIAVDDYGTGFSSLGYLKRLPVKELKIDKSFVLDMTRDENDAVIVRSTIELAHNLGLRVVAEGVETREMWDLLQMLGCETAQGYYMSKPLGRQEFEHWMKAPKLLPLLSNEAHGRQRHLLP